MKTAVILAGVLGWACGGSSQDGLFGKSGAGGCASANQCVSNFGAGGSAAGGFVSAGGENALGGITSTGGGSLAGGSTSTGGESATGGTFGTGGEGAGGLGAGGGSTGGASPDSGPNGTGGTLPVLCPSGHFQGKLAGPYTSLTGTRDIGASIDFSISDRGIITGTFTGPGPAKATLTGSVDCASGILSIRIEGGTYPGVLSGNVKFSGTIGAHYSTSINGFTDGTWTITEPSSSNNGGTGTWS